MPQPVKFVWIDNCWQPRRPVPPNNPPHNSVRRPQNVRIDLNGRFSLVVRRSGGLIDNQTPSDALVIFLCPFCVRAFDTDGHKSDQWKFWVFLATVGWSWMEFGRCWTLNQRVRSSSLRRPTKFSHELIICHALKEALNHLSNSSRQLAVPITHHQCSRLSRVSMRVE
jgi:hypothetical protein